MKSTVLTHKLRKQNLIAEARTDRNLMPALGAPPAQHGSPCLGLHAGQKPVGLRAMAAVRLKGTLRHFTSLLLNLVDAATVFQYTGLFSASLQRTPYRTTKTAKNRLSQYHARGAVWKPKIACRYAEIVIFTRNGATSFLSLDRLKIVVPSVLLSNPLTKDDLFVRYIEFWFHLKFLSAPGGQDLRGDL